MQQRYICDITLMRFVCAHIYIYLTNGHKMQRSLCPCYIACHFLLCSYSILPAVCPSNAPLFLSTGMSQMSTVLKLCRYTCMCICSYWHMCMYLFIYCESKTYSAVFINPCWYVDVAVLPVSVKLRV